MSLIFAALGVFMVFAVLSVIVLVHEFGHFIVAKWAGVWVEEFGLGLPPRVWGRKIGETIYSINALPIGGFVRLHGEVTGEGVSKPSRAFLNKPKKWRVAVSLAGIFMNFVLAVFCFSVFYWYKGVPIETTNVKVIEISEGSPAQIAGFVVGDIVRKVNKTEITATNDFVKSIGENKGKYTNIEVERGGEIRKFLLTPRENPPEGEGPLGVAISTTAISFPPFWKRPFVGAYYGTKDTLNLTKAILASFLQIGHEVTTTGQIPKEVVGPAGIFAFIYEIRKLGVEPLINLVGMISLNLAIFNLIPFPPLDGSRVLFIIIEAITRKRVPTKIEEKIHAVGMILLLILMLVISSREIPRLIKAGSTSRFVDEMVK
ncbi:MAG: M50 family metallopeptidase [Patescibacteria group bacterium]